jgi:hypothetical protein
MTVTDKDIKEIIEVIVEFANDNMDLIRKEFPPEFLKNSLALVIVDMDRKYGFFVRNGRFRVIEGEEVDKLEATAVVETTKDFIIEFINADDWVSAAVYGYNTYKVFVKSSDGRDFVHYKNLMWILRWLSDKIREALGV